MKRLTIAILACAGVLVGAPAASADQAALTVNAPCTGKATWVVNTDESYADVSVQTNGWSCKRNDVSIDDAGNAHFNQSDAPYSGGYRVNLLAAGIFGANTFVATADRGSIPIGPVVATLGILNAELTAPNAAVPGSSTEIHRGTGSCGNNCYLTDITWVHAYDRMP